MPLPHRELVAAWSRELHVRPGATSAVKMYCDTLRRGLPETPERRTASCR